MESLVVYNFYVRVAQDVGTRNGLSESYSFSGLYEKFHSLLPFEILSSGEVTTKRVGKKYMRIGTGFPAVNDPQIHFWTMQAGKDENHIQEGTAVYLDEEFHGLPPHQMVKFPGNAKFFKDYFVGILGRNVILTEDGDWHVQGNVFLLERGKNSLKSEMEMLLRQTFDGQRCELRKVVSRKRLQEIEADIEALKFTGKIRPEGIMEGFGKDRELIVNFTLSTLSGKKIKAIDFAYGKSAIKEFMLEGGKAQVIINANGGQRTVAPSRIDGTDEYTVQFDSSWCKKISFPFIEFQESCLDYLRQTTELVEI